MKMKREDRWMGRAVELAKQAGEGTRPNPRVGAVVVKGGKVVGEGFHRKAGQPHAEIEALRRAGAKARGADLYVTLEPCSTHGRTPPCTEAIRKAGIRRLVYGANDVDPRNAGRADRILRAAGVRVERGVLRRECEGLNEDYRHWTEQKEPWVILKLAMTLDGALAVPGRKWITGPEARAEVQRIRAGCDAILVGAETVRRDNPRLTVRGHFDILPNVETPAGRQPWRVVVTRSGRLPKQAKIFTDAQRHRTLVYRGQGWSRILRDLWQRGVCRLLVEGGAKAAAGLIAAKKVHEAALFFAPEMTGGKTVRLGDWAGWSWRRASVTGAGRDLCLRGTLKGAN